MKAALAFAVVLLVPGHAVAQWQVTTESDEFTGQRFSWATASGIGGEHIAGVLRPPYLGLQCSDGGASLYFETRHTFLNTSGDRISGMLKVDGRPTLNLGFSANAEGTGGFIRASRRVDNVWRAVEDMKAGITAKLRVRDFRGAAYDYEFPLRGVTRALTQLGCFDLPETVSTTPNGELVELIAFEPGERVRIGTSRAGSRARLRSGPGGPLTGSSLPYTDLVPRFGLRAEVLETATTPDGDAWVKLQIKDERTQFSGEGWLPVDYLRRDR